MHGRRHPSLRPLGADPVPDRKVSDATPTFTDSPLPRHRGIRVHPSLAASRAAHPSNYRNNVIDLNQHDYCTQYHLAADTRCRTCGANPCWLWCPECDDHRAGTGSHAVPCTHRRTDSQALGPVRPRGRAVGDQHRVARIELPARRREPHWLLRDFPDGIASARGPVQRGRLSRLVDGEVGSGAEHHGGRNPVCVVGTFALAIVTWTLILWAVI